MSSLILLNILRWIHHHFWDNYLVRHKTDIMKFKFTLTYISWSLDSVFIGKFEGQCTPQFMGFLQWLTGQSCRQTDDSGQIVQYHMLTCIILGINRKIQVSMWYCTIWAKVKVLSPEKIFFLTKIWVIIFNQKGGVMWFLGKNKCNILCQHNDLTSVETLEWNISSSQDILNQFHKKKNLPKEKKSSHFWSRRNSFSSFLQEGWLWEYSGKL